MEDEEEAEEIKNSNLQEIDMDNEANRDALMFRLYNATTSENVVVRAKAYEVLNFISTANYLHMEPYATLLVQRTVECLKTEDDLVVHQILELWMAIAEMEAELSYLNVGSYDLVSTHAKDLLPAILDLLPSRVSDTQYVEEIVSPPKSIFTAAILTLWLFIDSVPETTSMQLLAPFVGKHIPPSTSNDWKLRKSAIGVLALLSPLEECETLVRSCIGLVIDAGISSLTPSSSSSSSSKSIKNGSHEEKAESSGSTSKTNDERNLSLSDTAAFCISQISELRPNLLEEKWGAITKWMSSLNPSNSRSEAIILATLIDSLVSYTALVDQDINVEASLLPHLPHLLREYVRWSADKSILQFSRQCVALFNGFESLSDLFSENNHLERYSDLIESIASNFLNLLESSDNLTPIVTSALFSAFEIGIMKLISESTVKRLVSQCLKRGAASKNFEELQEVILVLIGSITARKNEFVPFIGETCEFVLRILKETSFDQDAETSIIPLSEMRPQDEEEDYYEGSETEEDYLGAVEEENGGSKMNVDSKPTSRSVEGEESMEEEEVKQPMIDSDFGAMVAPNRRKDRQEQVFKSQRIVAKNIVVEDCLRLVGPLMDCFSIEELGQYTRQLQVALLQLALKVPPSFVSLLSTLSLSLASVLGQDVELVESGVRPLLKLIEQITKTIISDSDQQPIYNVLLTAFQSTILATDEKVPSHMLALHDALEQLLGLIKLSTKNCHLFDDDVCDTALSASISLIGDYLSKVASCEPRQIDAAGVNRLQSTFDLIVSQWADPDPEVLEYTLSALKSALQEHNPS